MPRYVVERTHPRALVVPDGVEGERSCLGMVGANFEFGVTWVHSYISEDLTKSFCVCDGPSPEAIRRAAAKNGLPVDQITKVRVLDPYFYPGEEIRP